VLGFVGERVARLLMHASSLTLACLITTPARAGPACGGPLT
jgi:hypothetical protein